MKNLILVAIGLGTGLLFASITPEQEKVEKASGAVVRNKIYYKAGHVELGLVAGLLPYDSLVNDYLFGGRLTWHISDHMGWEILDGLYSLASVSSYAQTTTQTNSSGNTINLQLNATRLSACSSLVISPFYGKIKFLGDQSLYFDMYLVIGLGMSQVDQIQLSSTNQAAPTQTTVATTWDPTMPIGFGFKLFLNPGMGLLIDFRDYLSLSTLYGNKIIRGNFSFFLGINFFLPTFG